jgi:hypothetical protein
MLISITIGLFMAFRNAPNNERSLAGSMASGERLGVLPALAAAIG